jgi:lipoate-protein ligase A
MKKDHPLAGNSPGESYHMLCSGIIEGLKTLGIESEFSGINDILVNGKKVSGNAQTRRLGCILQHGTILLDNDIETMFAVLKVPSEKLKGKLIEEVKERVTNLRAALGREVPFDEAIEAFSSGFAKAMDLEYVPSEPSPAEGRRAGELAAEKFASLQWLHRR